MFFHLSVRHLASEQSHEGRADQLNLSIKVSSGASLEVIEDLPASIAIGTARVIAAKRLSRVMVICILMCTVFCAKRRKANSE